MQHVREHLGHNGVLSAIIYWLAVPTLILAELLGAGEHDADNCRPYQEWSWKEHKTIEVPKGGWPE